MGKKLKNNNNVVITPIKEVYEPKIKNSKNENAYGILLHTRKSIEECNASIHAIEREKIEKEQAAIKLRELLENLRLERQASKIEQNKLGWKVPSQSGNGTSNTKSLARGRGNDIKKRGFAPLKHPVNLRFFKGGRE